MSRFASCRDMSADEIIRCGYDAMAIVSLCAAVADDIGDSPQPAPDLPCSIGRALVIANELIAVVHDTVEIHEEVISAAKSTG